jgi:hypothetical protein
MAFTLQVLEELRDVGGCWLTCSPDAKLQAPCSYWYAMQTSMLGCHPSSMRNLAGGTLHVTEHLTCDLEQHLVRPAPPVCRRF